MTESIFLNCTISFRITLPSCPSLWTYLLTFGRYFRSMPLRLTAMTKTTVFGTGGKKMPTEISYLLSAW